MRLIRHYDGGDYDAHWPVVKRDSVRAVITGGANTLLLIHSDKYGDYAFPGGGIEPGEAHEDTLIREVLEEAGRRVIPSTIRPYGRYLIRRKSVRDNEIWEQDNFYYSCEIDPDFTADINTEGYEKEYGYHPIFITAAQAAAANRALTDTSAIPWVTRETYVLEELARATKNPDNPTEAADPARATPLAT